MTTKHGFRLAIEWGNPYIDPPVGRPRILAEKYIITDHACPPMPEEFHAIHDPLLGTPYNYTISYINVPTKPLPPEKLASIRRKRLERRMEKYPLFAEQFINDEMNKKCDYYDGITDEKLQAEKDSALERERLSYEKLLTLGEYIDHPGEEKL